MGNPRIYLENGPYGGWTPVAPRGRHRLWRHTSGKISYWTSGSDGASLSDIEHGPYGGWTAILTTVGLL